MTRQKMIDLVTSKLKISFYKGHYCHFQIYSLPIENEKYI